MKLDELDKRIIACLQGDLPLTKTPFADLAADLGITEKELLHKISVYLESDIMRRFGAVLHHQEAGFSANAMCCWVVPEELIEHTGKIMASFSEASHVFQRPCYPDWPYNLYTMIHARSRKILHSVVKQMSLQTGIDSYRLLFSKREFKKTSMKYF
ncbi:MAG: AsnC family transcriptional regulator [Bacillota bacterium]